MCTTCCSSGVPMYWESLQDWTFSWISSAKRWNKVYEEDCLDFKNICLGIETLIWKCNFITYLSVTSNRTGFDIIFLFSTTLKIFHHNATFDGLADEFNDYFSDGKNMNVKFNRNVNILLRLWANRHTTPEDRVQTSCWWLVFLHLSWDNTKVSISF